MAGSQGVSDLGRTGRGGIKGDRNHSNVSQTSTWTVQSMSCLTNPNISQLIATAFLVFLSRISQLSCHCFCDLFPVLLIEAQWV